MGVSVRIAVFVCLCLLALAPRPAAAASITLSGSFVFDNDVELYHFTLEAGNYEFLAETTSYATGGFDPSLALYGAGDHLVTYEQGGGIFEARHNDINDDPASPPLNLDAKLEFLLTVPAPTSFTLAVIQGGNEPLDPLSFSWDDDGFKCATSMTPDCMAGEFIDFFTGAALSNEFSLNLTVTPVSSAPEPGTLSLIALGTVAAALKRRRRARYANTN
jgi:hypothetical protein